MREDTASTQAFDRPGPSRPNGRGAPGWLWALAGLLALAVVAVVVVKAWPLLYPPVSERAPLNSDCDLRAGACSVRFASGGTVSLDVTPRGIPAVQPLQIEVESNGLPSPQRVEIDFVGVAMDMGFNRSTLERADGTDGSDRNGAPGRVARWRGRAMLPVCVRERMTWEARVLLHDREGVRVAPFRFDSVRPGAG